MVGETVREMVDREEAMRAEWAIRGALFALGCLPDPAVMTRLVRACPDVATALKAIQVAKNAPVGWKVERMMVALGIIQGEDPS